MITYPNLCRAGIIRLQNIPFFIEKELHVIHVLSGNLDFSTVAGTQTLQQGQTEIINVKEPVQMVSASPEEKVCILYFAFDKYYLNSIDYNFEAVTYNCNIIGFYSMIASDEKIEMLKQRTASIISKMLNGTDAVRMAEETNKFLHFIMDNFTDMTHIFTRAKKIDSVAEERFKRINAYMLEHVSEKVSLQDIATQEYLSVPYLSKEFTVKLDKNFKTIINYYRIINAVILLLDTDYSLTFIAENSGFSSTRYYNKIFKEYMGFLPSEFRSLYKHATPVYIEEDITPESLLMMKNSNPHSPISTAPVNESKQASFILQYSELEQLISECIFQLTGATSVLSPVDSNENHPFTATLCLYGKQDEVNAARQIIDSIKSHVLQQSSE